MSGGVNKTIHSPPVLLKIIAEKPWLVYDFIRIFRYGKGKENNDLNDGSTQSRDTVVKSIELHDIKNLGN